MRAESGEVVNVTFTRIVRETYEFGVDASAVIDALREHAPDIARAYDGRTVKEALDWLQGMAPEAAVLMHLAKLPGTDTPESEEEIEDFEHDAEDMDEWCTDGDHASDEHCEECGECDCTCDEEDEEDEEDED